MQDKPRLSQALVRLPAGDKELGLVLPDGRRREDSLDAESLRLGGRGVHHVPHVARSACTPAQVAITIKNKQQSIVSLPKQTKE